MDFRAVYLEHFELVWRSLRRFGVPEADLADAAQDVFLVVHRRLSSFEGRAKLTTWLLRICWHQVRDRRQRAHARHEVVSSQRLEAQASDELDPAQRLERDEQRRSIEAALARMSLEQRVVFVAFELEGFSGREIAELTEVPLATVHSRLRLAREIFARAFERTQAIELRSLAALEGG
jgi:RNA polymerase sigma-70 factor (ECF subfamily)